MGLQGPQGPSRSSSILTSILNWLSLRMCEGISIQGTSGLSSSSRLDHDMMPISWGCHEDGDEITHVKHSAKRLGRQQAIRKCEARFFHYSWHKNDESLS